MDVVAAFADPAFARSKVQGAPFTVLRPGTGAVLWANAAAAVHWGSRDAAALGHALFGPDGQGGWLAGFAGGLVPGRAPRLVRGGLTRGPGRRAHVALIRAWTDREGEVLVGLAVPDVAAGGRQAGTGAWLTPAWEPFDEVTTCPDADGDGPAPEELGPVDDPGATLARRGQLAVLRDRMSRALDGGAGLRFVWRTDASGALAELDDAALIRLGSPLRFGAGPWPALLASFDAAGADRLRSALAARTTWSGLPISLPVTDGAATVPLSLNGSPIVGPGRVFAGFRGFGVLDLAALALATRPAPTIAAAAESPPGPVAPNDDPRPSGDAAEAFDREPDPADPRPQANVVQLRAFQSPSAGRQGASPVPSVTDAEPSKPLAHADERRPDEGSAAPEVADDPMRELGGSHDDRLAFLALGEALRARIGASEAPSGGSPPIDVPKADADVATDDPTWSLLRRFPVGVVATVDDAMVFANLAAASLLGHRDPAALLAAGVTIVPSRDGRGRVAALDPEGCPVSAAARRTDATWDGAAATLWSLADHDRADADDVSAVPVQAGDAIRPPRPADTGGSDAAPVAGAGPAVDASGAADGEAPAAELLDRVDDAVALLDASGRVRRLNRRGEGWFAGPGAAAVLGQSFTELLEPESRPAALALLGEVRDQRDGGGAPPLRRDVAARTGHDEPVPMLLTLGRLGPRGFYATLRDVTVLKHAESDRARTERDHARVAGRLPDLLAKVSHEIRTPLGAVLGFAEVMMDERFGPLGNERYKGYLKDIHASGSQVVALVDDLLDLSRIEAGQIDLAMAAVDVNRVVTETVAHMQPEAHRGRVIMRTSLAGRMPTVLADERSTRQIVENLLSNAVKFNEPGGQVIISTALGDAGTVLLRVRDTGVGMTDEEIAAALEPFGGLSLRPSVRGNGLGLPLTRALVAANGASMTIRSRPREGTLVEVSFTAVAAGEARLPA